MKLTPVMNLGTDELVLLPLDNALVVQQANIRRCPSLDMMVIDGPSYEDLRDVLSLNKVGESVAQQFFIDRCNSSSIIGCRVLSDKAYGIIYNELTDAGDSIKALIENMGRILMSYYEDTPLGVLESADEPTEDENGDRLSESDLLNNALELIGSSDHQTHIDHYLNGEIQVILYSAS